MKFKPGQEIICLVPKGGWREQATNLPVNGPDRNEIVTADGYHEDGTHVFLKEYPHPEGWEDCAFEPLIEDSILEKELESITQTIES